MSDNLQIKLKKRATGIPGDDCWDVGKGEKPTPGDGEILVKSRYISLDPAMRGWITEGKSYVPPVALGEIMRAYGTAEVVDANGCDGFKDGAIVVGMVGWQEYAALPAKDCRVIHPELVPETAWLGAVGMPGVSAYFGLTEIGQPKEGETVLVSAAAGAVGSIAGQIAKILGCRAVGLAGGPDKCQFVTDTLGLDACIDYKANAGAMTAAVKEACPDGVDVYFDNVGGEILDAALACLNRDARVVICGAISQYNKNRDDIAGPSNYLSLLVNRARMQGFIVMDYSDRFMEAGMQLAQWVAQGKIHYDETIVDGLEQAPAALRRLFSGDKRGKLMIRVG